MGSSLAGRCAAGLALVTLLAATAAATATRALGSALLGALLAFLLLLPGLLWLATRMTRSQRQVLAALADGISTLKDRDYSLSIAEEGPVEVTELVRAYNGLGEVLRRHRLDLHQRELLLDTVIQTTPQAMVLTSADVHATPGTGRIIFGNLAARALLSGGRRLEGAHLDQVLTGVPEALREAVAGHGDILFTVEEDGTPQVYHLSRHDFLLNARPHRLLLIRRLTRELAAQEVAVWKKVIRVIAHELNNSLAPISSLAHSGGLIAQDRGVEPLGRVFTTIAERAAHLTTFIDGYARFAKLPLPQPQEVCWSGFLGRLADTMPFVIAGTLPERAAHMDASQMEQVMINLLKNAVESGSPREEICVRVQDLGHAFLIEVADRGGGLPGAVLQDALLPFYSTKAGGSGLGLTLCREIIEAHSGRISLANREGGGARVTLWLPCLAAPEAADAPSPAPQRLAWREGLDQGMTASGRAAAP
jgi:nitrogen fixation/metabolism regulation signal transduction histidine kinase